MTTPLRVLVVEDSKTAYSLLLRELRNGGYEPTAERVDTAEAMRSALGRAEWDIIISDHCMPHFDSMGALKLAREANSDLPFIIVSGVIGEEIAVEAMRAGAGDYVMKEKLARLVPAVERELREANARRERQEAKASECEIEERYRALVEGTSDLVQSVAADGSFLFVNRAWRETLGYSEDDVRKLSMFDVIHPDSMEHCEKMFRRVMAGEAVSDIKATFMAKDGRKIFVEGNASCRMVDGRLVATQGIFRDVTERRQAKERYRAIFEGAAEGILVADIETRRFRYANPAVCGMLGYTEEELARMSVADLHPKESLDYVVAEFEAQARGEKPLSPAVPCLRKDGSVFHADVTTAPAVIDGRKCNVGFFTDVTDRKRVEEALWIKDYVFESSIAALSVADKEGVIHTVNQAFVALWGYDSKEDAAGSLISDFFANQDDAVSILRALNEKGKWEGEFVALRKDGSTFISHNMATVMHGEDGEVIGYQATCVDMTRQREAEKALRESERRLTEAQRLAHLGNWSWNIVTNELQWSDEIYRIFGLQPQEFGVTYDAFLDSVHSDDQESVKEAVGRALLDPNVGYSIEHRVVRPDGTERVVHELAETTFDETGKPVRMIGTVQDITERKQAESLLQAERDKLALTLAELTVGVAIFDPSGQCVSANDAIARMIGATKAEVLAQNYNDIELWSKSGLLDAARKAVSEGSRQRHEIKTMSTFGEGVWMDCTLTPCLLGGEKHLMLTTYDIKEHRLLEEQFRQSQKMEAVGRLAGGIAHDFNNMLGAVIGYSDVILHALKESDPLHQDVRHIKAAADRAAGLTRQLLAFSRKQVLEPRVLDLNNLVSDLDKMLRRLIGEDIEFRMVLQPDVGRVKADPGQIEQVIMNLAVNSRDAMPDGGKLTIETANVDLDEDYAEKHAGIVPGPHVMIAVTDTGCGMDEETRRNIFEPFFTTKELGKGTGLGLSTAYGIVKQSGGSIWVYSEPGRGTTFKVYLPLVTEALAVVAAPKGLGKSPRGSETILVVEDEDLLRRLTTKILKIGGYRLLEAANGGEALLLSQDFDGGIDLLLTDVVMPRMSGRQLADHLVPLRPDMKVLYTSGYTDDAIVHQGVLEEGTPFIQKPFSASDLLNKVREVLNADGVAT